MKLCCFELILIVSLMMGNVILQDLKF